MNNFPLVSVIVPTHNRPVFLRKTVQSILQQTYKNMEILIISNGFNVHNKKVCEDFSDKRLFYFEQENSGGPASPRNHGIKRARGKYVAFCDDDDLWMQDKLEKQVFALENNVKYGLCYTKMIRFNEMSEWNVPCEEGQANFETLLYKNVIPISSVFIKKKLIDFYGGFCEAKTVGLSEDYEFLLRYALHVNFLFMDEYLIKYWSGGDRTTSNTFNFFKLLYYFYGVLGCYYQLYVSGKVPCRKLIKPIFYNFKLMMKNILYQAFVKVGMKKKEMV